jgi:hypothetical protein
MDPGKQNEYLHQKASGENTRVFTPELYFLFRPQTPATPSFAGLAPLPSAAA